jgi:ribosome maturation factor RimP
MRGGIKANFPLERSGSVPMNRALAFVAKGAYRALVFSASLEMLRSVPTGSGGKTALFLSLESQRLADIALLTQLIEPHVKDMGLSLVRISMFGGTSDPTLQVMAERPETRQLVIEDCAELSRRISETLDETDPIEEAYRLEVSSPGIDRPLTRLKDFEDWEGFDARLRLSEMIMGRKQVDGRLGGLIDDDILITTPKTRETLHIPYSAVASAKLLLTDALIKATAPLSSDGADVISEER